jgi:FkbM family methyltransferase
MSRKIFYAGIPVTLECPDEMEYATNKVLKGEYESGYFGAGLTILDIGANVGSFSIWASMRWPRSQIHAYEPNPETFKMLTSNVSFLPNVACHNVAVSPSGKENEPFFSRYVGDGEAGLVTYLEETFERMPHEKILSVSVCHPKDLPECDVIKIDVEGAEAAILENMNLDHVSLILLEYQYDKNRISIMRLLKDNFTLERENRFEWKRHLPASGYRRDLQGDYFGHLFFINRKWNRLEKLSCNHSRYALLPLSLQFGSVLTTLSHVIISAFLRRLRRLRKIGLTAR